jgi:hypothetical protein
MNRPFITLLATLSAVGAATAIDLTPRYATTDADGISISRPYFADGDKRYAVTVDSETQLVAFDNSTVFNFTKFPHAVMRLRQSPLKAETPFDGEGLASYREAATRMLLNGAENPVIESETSNVMPINHWTSRRFTFTYGFLGAQMRETVTFLNLDAKQQVVFQIRADKASFPTVSARAEDIIRRWHLLVPGADAAGN